MPTFTKPLSTVNVERLTTAALARRLRRQARACDAMAARIKPDDPNTYWPWERAADILMWRRCALVCREAALRLEAAELRTSQ